MSDKTRAIIVRLDEHNVPLKDGAFLADIAHRDIFGGHFKVVNPYGSKPAQHVGRKVVVSFWAKEYGSQSISDNKVFEVASTIDTAEIFYALYPRAKYDSVLYLAVLVSKAMYDTYDVSDLYAMWKATGYKEKIPDSAKITFYTDDSSKSYEITDAFELRGLVINSYTSKPLFTVRVSKDIFDSHNPEELYMLWKKTGYGICIGGGI